MALTLTGRVFFAKLLCLIGKLVFLLVEFELCAKLQSVLLFQIMTVRG